MWSVEMDHRPWSQLMSQKSSVAVTVSDSSSSLVRFVVLMLLPVICVIRNVTAVLSTHSVVCSLVAA